MENKVLIQLLQERWTPEKELQEAGGGLSELYERIKIQRSELERLDYCRHIKESSQAIKEIK